MKKFGIMTVLGAVLLIAGIVHADKTLPVFSKGQTVYVCGCGPDCDCLTVSQRKGVCSCNKPLVKTKVSRVEKDSIIVKVKGKEQRFTTVAKYACACGEGCNCGTISQKPGKCACGNDMKEVR